MIVEFFKHGKGSSKRAIEYLLGKDLNREHAKLLDGNIEEVAELIDSSPYSKKYTSGCLSFYEDDLTDDVKQSVMKAFEKVLFPDLSLDENFKILWIEHRDKDNHETNKKRLELNFLIPNLEISTGKRLQPFYAPADLERVDIFKRNVNHRLKLFDPDDPMNRQSLKVAKHLPKNLKEFTKALDREVALAISELDEAGQPKVKDRESLLLWMKEIGLEVTKTTKKQISVKNPDKPDGRPIVLKGEFYEQNFRCTETSADYKRRASEEYRRDAEKRFQDRCNRARELMQSKAEYNRTKFRQTSSSSQRDYSRQHQIKTNSHTSEYDDFRERNSNINTRTTENITRELNSENNAFRSENRSTRERVSDRSEQYEQDVKNTTSEHEKRLSDIHRIKRSNSQANAAKETVFESSNIFSFDSLYIAYSIDRSNVYGLQQNKRNRRNEPTNSKLEKAGGDSERDRLRQEAMCGNRSEAVEQYIHDNHNRRQTDKQNLYNSEREKLNELANTIIENNRRSAEAIRIATERTSESIRANTYTINSYQRVTRVNNDIESRKHSNIRDYREAEKNQQTVVRTNYLSDFFRDITSRFTSSIRQSFERTTREFRSSDRSERDYKNRITTFSGARVRESNDRVSESDQKKTRLSEQLSREVKGFNGRAIYEALEVLDRRKQFQLEQKRKRDNDYDSPSF